MSLEDAARQTADLMRWPMRVCSGARKSDVLAIGFLLISHLILGIAFVRHTETMCFSDCVIEYELKLGAFAREVQAGALPLADHNTFAGAKSHYFSSVWLYYPLTFPLYWFVDPENPRQVAEMLIVGPFAFHLLLSALGAYAFARSCLRVSSFAALGTAWVYTFASSMLTLDYLNQVSALSYLPWVTLATTRWLGSGAASVWIVGAGLLGLMNVASNPTLSSKVWFLVGLQAVCLLLSSRSPWRRSLWRLVAVAAMGLVGVGLAAYALAGLYDGLLWIRDSQLGTCQKVMDFSPGSSLDPVSLWSLVFPYAFIRPGGEMFLGGGFVLLQLVGLGALTAFRPIQAARDRDWPRIGLVLFALGLLILLGKYTPVYGWLCGSIPGFFSFPHPVSWGVVLAWGSAILAGFGLQRLGSQPSRLESSVLLVLGCAAAVFVVLGRLAIRDFRWDDALVAPQWYLAIAAIWCFVAILVPVRRRALILTLGLLAECLVTPVAFLLQAPAPPVIDPWAFPQYTLQNDAFRELRPALKEVLSRQSARFVGLHSYIDNQAWAVDGRALLGYQPVALYPRFLEASKYIFTGYPYSLFLTSTSPFLQNMNVQWVVAYRLRDTAPDPPWFNRAAYLTQIQPQLDPLPIVARTEHFEIRELPSPLPYAYAQDRIVPASEAEQLAQLVHSDLRQAAYVDADVAASIGDLDPGADTVEHFEQMQAANRVRSVHAGGNQIQLEVDFATRAMLVIVETAHPGWRATVDGESVPLLRVNYLQEGVWLEPGSHLIELQFRPLAAGIGIAVSLFSLGLIMLVWRRGRRSRDVHSAAPFGAPSSGSA